MSVVGVAKIRARDGDKILRHTELVASYLYNELFSPENQKEQP